MFAMVFLELTMPGRRHTDQRPLVAAGCGSDRAWRPVEFPGGAEYRPSLLEASQLQLSQGPLTRPLPVESGVEEGLAGVFLLPTIPNIVYKQNLCTLDASKELIVEDTG